MKLSSSVFYSGLSNFWKSGPTASDISLFCHIGVAVKIKVAKSQSDSRLLRSFFSSSKDSFLRDGNENSLADPLSNWCIQSIPLLLFCSLSFLQRLGLVLGKCLCAGTWKFAPLVCFLITNLLIGLFSGNLKVVSFLRGVSNHIRF